MRFLTAIYFCLIVFALPYGAHADVDIPRDLTRNHLSDVVELLGFSTSSKFLSNPYPLGGYSGFEVGFQAEFINVADLELLGSGTGNQDTFQYNRITVGKGLFYDIDAFVHFIPFSTSNEISEYGGVLKWMFYEATFIPMTLSILGHASTINIQDSYINENLGWDILGGITLNRFSIYFGAGRIHARSTFSSSILCYVGSGGCVDPEITLNSNNTYIVRNTQSHSMVGVQVEFQPIFIAAQIDRYEQPVYSAKIGLRY